MDTSSPRRFVPVKFFAWRPTSVDIFCKIASAALAKNVGVVSRWAYRHGFCGPSKTIAAFTGQACVSEMEREKGQEEKLTDDE